MKAAAPRRDPVVRTILYVVGGLVLAGVAFNVLGNMGLINGFSRPAATAQTQFSATGTIHTRTEHAVTGQNTDIADMSGTVTNNTGRACSKTSIVGTMLDRNDGVVSVRVAASVATDPGQTATWSTSVPFVGATNTVTRATWEAICSDPR